MALSASNVAELFSVKIGMNINQNRIKALMESGFFKKEVTDKGLVRFDTADVLAKLETHTHYVDDLSIFGESVYRAGVVRSETSKDVVIEERGEPVHLGSSRGVNYADMSDVENQIIGMASDMAVKQYHADMLRGEKALVVFACKGYVHPLHVRRVLGWRYMHGGTQRKFLVTKPLDVALPAEMKHGFWIDMPSGRSSGLAYSVRG